MYFKFYAGIQIFKRKIPGWFHATSVTCSVLCKLTIHIYHIHACILKLSLRDKHKPKVRYSLYMWKISMFTTFFTSHHYKPFTFHYQTSKHYLWNNIPVFESIHSMLNLLSTKNKALLLTTFQIPGINMQNIHTQKVKSCI